MKRIILVISFFVVYQSVSAQVSSDYGVFAGIGQEHLYTILPIPTIQLNGAFVGPALGLFYRYNFNPRYGIRAGGNANAYLGPNGVPLPGMIDMHVMAEFNYQPVDPRREDPKFSTFLGAGLGYLGNLGSLSPAKSGISIPFNIGVKYRVSEHFGLSIEWDLRKVTKNLAPTMDNLLAPSTWYSFAGITANYKIIKTCKTCPWYEAARSKKK